MATAIDMRGAPGGATHVDYDDGSSVEAPMDLAMQALVRRAMYQPKMAQPINSVTPPDVAAAFDRINRNLQGS